MKRSYISELKSGQKVLLKGWVFEIRELGKMKFILLRDASGIVQCVLKQGSKGFNEELTLESVVSIKGKVKKAHVKAELARHDIEIEVEDLKILSKAEELPIQVNEKTITTGLDKRLDYRSLDIRKPKIKAIFKIQASLVKGMQEWFSKNGFLRVFTPCLMGVASESGAEVFIVDYFNKKAFLRQDPQLHRQLTIAGGIEKLYDLGPSWRAEKSHTTKHLTEYHSIAPEMAFIKNEQDIMKVEEQVVVAGIKKAVEECKEELKLLNIELKVPKIPFPELRFPEIYEILKEEGKNLKKGEDLDAEAEEVLWKHVQKKYKTDFYFINKFPFKIKPFYVYHDEEYARSVDLMCKGIELSSGGQREHRYEVLMKNIKNKKIPLKSVEWFTKFFRYGVPPHGGFALGIERLTHAILSLSNIREGTLFPRDRKRITP